MSNNSRVAAQIKLWRSLAVQYLGGACQQCGSTQNLQIHHKNGNWRDENIQNLVLLCKNCHRQKHKAEFTEPIRIPKPMHSFVKNIYKQLGFRSLTEFYAEAVKQFLKKHMGASNVGK